MDSSIQWDTGIAVKTIVREVLSSSSGISLQGVDIDKGFINNFDYLVIIKRVIITKTIYTWSRNMTVQGAEFCQRLSWVFS